MEFAVVRPDWQNDKGPANLRVASVEEGEQSASCENHNAAPDFADRFLPIVFIPLSTYRVSGIAAGAPKRHTASVSGPLVF
jgi:hypothetical protein